jgi:uncharacterized GH25 family protein
MIRCFWMLVMFSLGMPGHDMWIEPATFWPAAGQVVGVKLRVGQELLGDPIPRSAGLIREFVVVDTAGRRSVIGREGSDPAGYVRGGAAVIGYWSHPSAVELEAGKFNAYLKEEGLESVLAERARRKQSDMKVREQFSRCAKSLLAGSEDRLLGFPLELLAERNPHEIGGAALPIRLTYENRPLAGGLVVAINRQRPAEKLTARTDKDGRVRLPIKGGGVWLVKAVHMIPAGEGWASYWASLTFGLER